jgi:2'-hydroxyisoflavone reductase
MNRRHVLKLAGAAASLAALGHSALSHAANAQRKLRVLVLGGTGFIGPHLVASLRESGHSLTLFNRGKRNTDLFRDIETRHGDRNGQLDALKTGTWDVVIDNSGYVPRHVQLSAELLKDRVQRYIFVSSISAYRDLAKPGIDEDYPVATLADPTVEEVNGDTYGGLKALCEATVERVYGNRATIIRPTYIVGPGDPTDRFTYWPVRVARGGEMLAPGTRTDPVQFVDVRDLTDFMQRCAEQDIAGRYNVTNPPRTMSMGALLDIAKNVSGSDARYVWADRAFLERENLLESGEIPIWSPPHGETAGFALVDPSRAVAKGLKFREVRSTVADTLAWHDTRPADQRNKLRAGLTPKREAELLRKLRAASR